MEYIGVITHLLYPNLLLTSWDIQGGGCNDAASWSDVDISAQFSKWKGFWNWGIPPHSISLQQAGPRLPVINGVK